mgnify:CR=1 FL=1
MKRFAHFGLNKTTMNEIASDLSFSKALLYYYFPDKLSVYAAVLERIFSEIAVEVDHAIEKAHTPEEALQALIDAEKDFLKKYFPLLDFSKFADIEKYQDLKTIVEKSNASEIKHIQRIIEIGVKTGKYQVADAAYTAQLLFEAIQGIRVFHLGQPGKTFNIDRSYLEMISNRQKEIVEIFLKGLIC